MELRSIEYIVEIEKTGSITKAAENMCISQSALNQQLLKLESQLGTQLFRRHKKACIPTEAGKVYLEGAKEILEIKHRTYSKINAITNSEKTELVLGLTPGRGITMFIELYPKLHAMFPNTRITPIESNVRVLQEGIAEGKIDIGFLTLNRSQKTPDTYIKITNEEIVAVVPRNRDFCRKEYDGKGFREISIKDLEHESFVLMFQKSTIRQICDELFESTGIAPYVETETSSTPSIPKIAKAMDCCGLIPRYYASPEDPYFETFVLSEHPTWAIYISYKNGAYLDAASKEYIKLVKEYWEENKDRISIR